MISPKGLHAPPAFAATTIFIAPGTKKSLFSFSIVINTVDSIKAVVKLSATGLIKNAKVPVIQYSFLYEYPLETRLYFRALKTFLSIKVSI